MTGKQNVLYYAYIWFRNRRMEGGRNPTGVLLIKLTFTQFSQWF